jgi:nitrile hydratase subunit beta
MGGQSGFGPVPVGDEDAEPFHADWEARVFALSRALRGNGVFNLDEMRDAIERIPPGDYLSTSYYERWLVAMETILDEKGIA